jgi:hypothetical protein
MYPEQPVSYQPADAKGSKVPIIIMIAVLVLIVGSLLFALLTRTTATYQQPSMYATSLAADKDFAHLNGSSLYAYNGLAFYKINQAARDKVTILNTGLKLPTPSNVYWADSKGALMTFKQSFISSAIEKKLTALGYAVTPATQAYTWYLDFATGSLQLVSTSSLQANQVLYSASENGFYFFADSGNGVKQLFFYHTDSGHTDTLIKDIQLASVSDLQKCSGNLRVCLTGYDNTDQTAQNLYGVTKTGSLQTLKKSNGFFITTNINDKIITVKNPANTNSHEPDTDFQGGPAELFDVKSQSSESLGFDIHSTDASAHYITGNDFVVFDYGTQDKKSVAYTSVTVNSRGHLSGKLFTLAKSDGSSFDNTITSVDQNGIGDALVTADNNNQFIFSTQKHQATAIVTAKTAQSIVDTCLKGTTGNSQYFEDLRLFRIFFDYDAGFNRHIQTFSTCLGDANDTPMTGYRYTFGGIDPTFHKIVTD